MKLKVYEILAHEAGKQSFSAFVEWKVNALLDTFNSKKVVSVDIDFDFRPGYERAVLTIFHE